MKPKNLLYVPLMVYLGATACNKGYPKEIEKELAPLRSRFGEVCKSKTDRTLHSGSLEEITKERDKLLGALGCELGCEEWNCWRGNYFGPNGGHYEAAFIKKGSCECKFKVVQN